MDEVTRISTGTRWEPVFGYSRAVKAGNLIVVSGTTATDANGTVIGINQMYSQARQAIANIAAALARAGGGLSDVIRTRIFVTDIGRFNEVARAHAEAFGAAPPASTLVEVRRLVHPDMMIEIEADALVRRAEVAAAPPRAKPAPRAAAKRPTARAKPGRRK